jgi:disulfide bond formation protein DsbB
MLVNPKSANPKVQSAMLAALRPLTRFSPAVGSALVVAAGGAATILGAWFFQYVLHYLPCPLCFEQRKPYYVAIPLALVVALAAARSAPRRLVIGGLSLLALVMVVSAGLGVYHAGIEWQFWAGPADCTGPNTSFGSAADMLKRISTEVVVQCDKAAWRFLGISLAGYNALISLALAAVAAWGAMATARGQTS